MPFIGTRVNIVLDEDKRERLKNRWDQAITLLPGKSPQSPAAFVEVKVFGAVDAAASDRLTAAITQALQEECGIAANRVYIAYEGIENWGWNGHNF